MVTTPYVISEIKRGSLVERVETLLQLKRVTIRKPNKSSIALVESKSKSTRDDFVLSETDTSIIALAIDLKKEGKNPIILTDDYSLQNTARTLNIKFEKIITPGIKSQWRWVVVCPGCHREFKEGYSKGDDCPVCGTKLVRYHPKRRRFTR